MRPEAAITRRRGSGSRRACRARAGLFAWALCGLLLGPGGVAAEPAPRQLQAEGSALAGVIEGLAGAPAAAHRDLATRLIAALVAAYEAELDPALLEQRPAGPGHRRLARWQQATAPLLSDLRRAQHALAAAGRVEVQADRQQQILLRIDERLVWVAWPRLSTQVRMERELAAEFCRHHECARAGRPGAAPPPTQGLWVLSQGRHPAWEHANGLRCEFTNLADRAGKEALCRAVVSDVYRLSTALRLALHRGESIDWDHLVVQADADALRQRIIVNARGDYLELDLPALAGRRLDWAAVGIWLQAQVQGQSALVTALRAEPG